MKLKPLHDQILVKKLPNEHVQASGLILLGGKLDPFQGEVIATGPGLRIEDTVRPMSLKPGDKVLFERLTGTPITIDNTEHLLMKEEEILGIIK